MAIRIRRGLYDDFDSTKMLPGEWAVAIDSDTSKQVVWMCFAPGVVKRMGTYEDFKQQIEEATAEIKDEYLTEFQAILDQIDKLAETTQSNTDTVIQIRDTTVDTYLPQMLKYLENAQAASKTATEQATSASTSATNAKTSETLAKSYMERAFSATPEGYDALVDNVNNIDIHTTTDSTLYGSKSGGLRVKHMIGKSVQRQLSGKNFVNNALENTTRGGLSFTVNEYKSVTVNGTATEDMTVSIHTITLPPGSYIMTSGVESSLNTYNLCFGSSAYQDTGTGIQRTFDESTRLVIYLRILSGVTVPNVTFYPMVRLATETDPTYEPYCGGTPSPNPEYRQSIHHTGDCVEMIQGRWNGETGAYTTSTTSICTKISIPCKSGDKVKVVLEKPLTLQCVYSTDSGHLSYKGVETVSEYEFTVPSNATKFKFNVINADGLTPQTVGKIQLTINGKYVVQIVEHGKNILGGLRFANALVKSGANVNNTDQINKTVTLIGTSQSSNKTIFSNFKSDTQYTIFFRGFNSSKNYPLKTNLRIGYTDGTTTLIDFAEGKAHTLYVTKVGKSIDSIFSVYDTGSANFYYEDFGIMEGVHTLEDFEPYTESTATIYLNEPPREGDIIAEFEGVWKVERHSAEVVFDGSEDERWEVSTAYENVYQNLDYGTYAGNNVILQSQLCSHYSLYNGNSMDDMTDGTCRLTTVFYFKNTSVSTLEEWKALLQSDPITVEYQLATPTYETLDTASQIALNSLKTFDTVTYLSVDSVTQPEELEVEFGKSKVGAYALKSLNDNDIDRIERAEMKAQLNELATALVAVGSEV